LAIVSPAKLTRKIASVDLTKERQSNEPLALPPTPEKASIRAFYAQHYLAKRSVDRSIDEISSQFFEPGRLKDSLFSEAADSLAQAKKHSHNAATSHPMTHRLALESLLTDRYNLL
jgi:hypothetical protein